MINYRLFIAVVLIFNSTLLGQPDRTTCKINEIKSNLEFLASNELEGRNAASHSEKVASLFIASEMEKYGIKPFGDNGTYLQSFKVISNWYDPSSNLSVLNEKNEKLFSLPLGEDFAVFRDQPLRQDLFNIPFEIVFAGYGISAPEFDYDNYKDLDVTGKVVMFLPGEPYSEDENFFSGSVPSDYSQFIGKVRTALQKGATGVIIIPEGELIDFWYVIQKQTLEEKMVFQDSVQPSSSEIPPIGLLSENVLDKFFEGEDFEYAELEEMIQSHQNLPAFKFKKKINFDLIIKYEEKTARNVVGIIKGNDPVLKNEYVVMGAHFDHVGMMRGVVFNGANDNGSGTVTILEIARRLTASKNNKRSVIAALFTGEEVDYLGSEYFIKNFPYPEDIVGDVTVDMCGRESIDTLFIMGLDKSNVEYERLIREANSETVNFSLITTEKYFTQSDHNPFIKRKIPGFFFCDNMITDLHKPSDDSDKINYDKICKTSRLVEEIVYKLANLDHKLSFAGE
ncbi:MAG: hypothetical protein A2V66_06830 [Ignavibacteria bacterium RBG_13_36_8]|nr:MAG: hypothetical protein A2V66_06830 [Ignavibacteria bacterium RBG_13_36_8]